MCDICADLRAGQVMYEHWKETKCEVAEQRLAIIGLINKTEQEEVAASSAPKQQ